MIMLLHLKINTWSRKKNSLQSLMINDEAGGGTMLNICKMKYKKIKFGNGATSKRVSGAAVGGYWERNRLEGR